MLATLDVLPVTSESLAAREAYDQAVVALLAGRAEAGSHANRALEEDANLAMAWIVLSILDRLDAGRRSE